MEVLLVLGLLVKKECPCMRLELLQNENVLVTKFFMGRELKYLRGNVWQSHTPLYREDDKKNYRIQTEFCARVHDGIRFSIKYNGTSVTVEPS
jgi:hypothetical protein